MSSAESKNKSLIKSLLDRLPTVLVHFVVMQSEPQLQENVVNMVINFLAVREAASDMIEECGPQPGPIKIRALV